MELTFQQCENTKQHGGAAVVGLVFLNPANGEAFALGGLCFTTSAALLPTSPLAHSRPWGLPEESKPRRTSLYKSAAACYQQSNPLSGRIHKLLRPRLSSRACAVIVGHIIHTLF